MARGGKRQGAGRRGGGQNVSTIKRRDIAARALAEGKSPLEVMIDNMRHFQQLALDAETTLAGLAAEEIIGRNLEPKEQFELLLAEVKKAAGLRQKAHECARDAAPYLHPRLASIQHSGELNVKRSAEMTDDELANIAARGSKRTTEAPIDPSQLN